MFFLIYKETITFIRFTPRIIGCTDIDIKLIVPTPITGT